VNRQTPFRLPDSARVGAVRYQVSDLEPSLWFYQQLVGLHLLDRRDSPRRARLGAGGLGVLLELVEKKGARAVPSRGLLGLYHSALLLPSRVALGSFVRHLDETRFPFGSADHLVSEALYLRDPDGLTLEVYADRPRSAWTMRGREIIATIDPLDVDDVRRAGAAEPWTGVPAGSTIGHMHFFVGDLERAEAFYHRGLGLDKVMWSLPGALFLSAGGYHHHVGTNTWAAGSPVATGDDVKLLEWELVVPDRQSVDEVGKSLEDAGFEIGRRGSEILAKDDWGITVKIRGA
jgi:catechol 2,3-dioxygenase